MKSNKHIIASVFLALFCVIQLAELHIIGHEDTDSECALCLLTLDQAEDDYVLFSSDIDIPEPKVVSWGIVKTNYVNRYFDSYFGCLPTNKAPPVV
ncbi:hypothetical protein GCM10009430_06000 [Aquimarina litoralis]|uniref:Uncharacterized protein n=1 Tax=Aquimarina litoralis TaxID=584605 RepID=A0ABP3TNT9_9FLAO